MSRFKLCVNKDIEAENEDDASSLFIDWLNNYDMDPFSVEITQVGEEMTETYVNAYSISPDILPLCDSLITNRFVIDGQLFLEELKDEYSNGLPEGKLLNVKIVVSTELVDDEN